MVEVRRRGHLNVACGFYLLGVEKVVGPCTQ